MKKIDVKVKIRFKASNGGLPGVKEVTNALNKLNDDGYIIEKLTWEPTSLPEATLLLGRFEVEL